MKHALITGASSPLGQAIAKHMSENGYHIGIHYYQNQTNAENLQHHIQTSGGQATLLPADLCQEKECISLLDSWLKATDSLEILINNAGVYAAEPLSELSEAQWHNGIHTTATATFLMTRAALPYLRKSTNGRVINIGDSSCDHPGARDLAMSYHIGKTGVLMLTKSFARAEAENDITVNMISPGYLENSIGLPDPASIPAKRYGTFTDITHAIDFLIQPESGYCTGSNLILSGGWNLR